jgi:hypothetical protein
VKSDLLLDCVIKFLQIIIFQYDSKKINYEEFRLLTVNKIVFLEENLNLIPIGDNRELAEYVLNKSKKIELEYSLP